MKKLLTAALLTLFLAACNTESESNADNNNRYLYQGSLTVTNAQNQVTYQAEDVKFEVTSQNEVVSLEMKEVMFDSRMPQPFTIVITDLRNTMLPGGGVAIESAVTPIVPLIGGTPYPSFRIPSFTGSIAGKELDIEFRCVTDQPKLQLDHTAVFKGTRTN